MSTLNNDHGASFILQWEQHHEFLCQSLGNELLSNALPNCMLSAEGEFVPINRDIASAFSPYLKSLLNQDPLFVKLEEIELQEMKSIVKYMNTGEVIVTAGRIERFFKNTEALQIKGILADGTTSADAVQILSSKLKVQRESHPKSDEDSTKNYPCQNGCGRSYKTKRSMLRHLNVTCGKNKQYSCEHCEKKYFYRRDLNNHKNRHHNYCN